MIKENSYKLTNALHLTHYLPACHLQDFRVPTFGSIWGIFFPKPANFWLMTVSKLLCTVFLNSRHVCSHWELLSLWFFTSWFLLKLLQRNNISAYSIQSMHSWVKSVWKCHSWKRSYSIIWMYTKKKPWSGLTVNISGKICKLCSNQGHWEVCLWLSWRARQPFTVCVAISTLSTHVFPEQICFTLFTSWLIKCYHVYYTHCRAQCFEFPHH